MKIQQVNNINKSQPAFKRFEMTVIDTGKTDWFKDSANKIIKIVLKNRQLSTERIVYRDWENKPFKIKSVSYIIDYQGRSQHKEQVENDLIINLKKWAQREGLKIVISEPQDRTNLSCYI